MLTISVLVLEAGWLALLLYAHEFFERVLGGKMYLIVMLVGFLVIPIMGVALGIWVIRRINRRRTHEATTAGQ